MRPTGPCVCPLCHRHRQQYGDCQRARVGGDVGEDKREGNGDEGKVTWGGEHTIHSTDEVM